MQGNPLRYLMDKNIAFTGFGVFVVLAVVAIFWYVMWKFVFEPNPVVREFFDLDLKDSAGKDGKEKKIA